MNQQKTEYEDANKKKPKVSVCCAWYNRPYYIHDTIKALIDQTFDDFEIIIVNDGSPDERVSKILDSYASPKITIVHQRNTGAPGALNHAISLAKGSYIAVHDSGDISLPDRLRLQVLELDQNPDIVGTGCLLEDVEIDGDDERKSVTREDKPKTLVKEDFMGAKNFLSGGEVMFRKEIYDNVGGYRDVFRYAQDRDLWLRLVECGPFHVVQTLLYERRIFPEGVKASLSKTIVQKQLSHFARECASMRAEKGYDLVDVFAGQAGLFRHRTRTLADILARNSLWYFYHGDLASAQLLGELAFREKLTVRSFVVRYLPLLYMRSERSERLIKRLLGRKITALNLRQPDSLV